MKYEYYGIWDNHNKSWTSSPFVTYFGKCDKIVEGIGLWHDRRSALKFRNTKKDGEGQYLFYPLTHPVLRFMPTDALLAKCGKS